MQVLDAVRQHLPAGADWAPLAIAVAVLLLGLVVVLRGARLAPVLSACVFMAGGCLAAPLVTAYTGLPTLPLMIIGGTLGLVIGIVLFRLWFALVVALSMIAATLGFYTAQTVIPSIEDFNVRGLQAASDVLIVTLPDAPAPGASSWFALPPELLQYLNQQHPSLGLNAAAIALASGAAGLFLALLLPKTARALWAATVGTLLFVPSAYFVLAGVWQTGADWLGRYPLVVAAIVWSASLLINLADVLEWHPLKRKRAAAAAAS